MIPAIHTNGNLLKKNLWFRAGDFIEEDKQIFIAKDGMPVRLTKEMIQEDVRDGVYESRNDYTESVLGPNCHYMRIAGPLLFWQIAHESLPDPVKDRFLGMVEILGNATLVILDATGA